jgi:hypothetical protein
LVIARLPNASQMTDWAARASPGGFVMVAATTGCGWA